MRKEKRSLSTVRGGGSNSRVTLNTQDHAGLLRDSSLGIINHRIDSQRLHPNASRLSSSRNTIAYKSDLTKL